MKNNDKTENIKTFIEGFRSAVIMYSEWTAVSCEENKLTYAELDELSDKVAAFIIRKKLPNESFIGIFQGRSIYYLVTLLGIMKSGNIYVPIDPDTLNPGNELFPKERLQFMVQDTNTSLIITDEGQKEFLQYLSCDSVSVEEILLKESALPQGLLPSVTGSSAAYAIYTSGSTGVPKLTVVEHHSLVNLYFGLNKNVFSTLHDAHQQMQVSINAPFGFDASLQQIVCLLNGYCLHIVPENCRRSVIGLIRFVQEKSIHILDCTPSQMGLLLRHGFLDNCQGMMVILIGGEAIQPDMWGVLEEVNYTAVYNVYGPTECCVDATIALINDGVKKSPHIGKPLDGNRVYLLDEHLSPVLDGEEGEIVIIGEGVARGYHNRPEINSKFFLDETLWLEGKCTERAYRTGDIGRMMPDGNIVFCGRKDEQMKLRSHRIEPAEICMVLRRFPSVVDCIVAKQGDGEYAEIIAYIIPQNNTALSDFIDDLNMYAKSFLPTYMLPNRFIEIEEVPLSINGKVDYSALPPSCLAEEEYESVEPGIENTIKEIVERVLKARIERDQNIMIAGGDSLRIMTILAEIYMKFMVEIDYACFFHSPTIAFLVSEISKSQKDNTN